MTPISMSLPRLSRSSPLCRSAQGRRDVLALAPASRHAAAGAAPLPESYSTRCADSLALFSQLTIMSLRHIYAGPSAPAPPSLGSPWGCGLLVTALFSFNSVEHMIDVAVLPDRPPACDADVQRRRSTHAPLQAVERHPRRDARGTL